MNTMDPYEKLDKARRLQQVLRENPNDVEALVELAAALDDPELKRKVLDRIITLDPANQRGREMLLELDRAAMSPVPPRQQAAASSNDQETKPVTFKYSIVHRILVYLSLPFFGLLAFMALGDGELGTAGFFGVLCLLLIVSLWSISGVVELSSSGLRLRRLFGLYQRELSWNEITSIRPNLMGQGIRLSSAQGTSLSISSQLNGYVAIVEILLRIRPDLFQMSEAGATGSFGQGTAAPVTWTRVFQKSFLTRYGGFFLLIPACLISSGSLLAAPFPVAILFGIILLFFWIAALNSIHTVKVEGDRLSTRSFRKQRELTAQAIKEVSLKSVRTRRGGTEHFIEIEPFEGNALTLSNFPEGNEFMYAYLANWWRIHRKQ